MTETQQETLAEVRARLDAENALDPKKPTAAQIENHLVNVFRSNKINIKDIDDLGRNYGKTIPCSTCGKNFISPEECWNEEESWEVCFNCGVKKAKKKMGVPKRYQDADIMKDFPSYTWDQREILCRNSLFIYGPTGTGKTHLAFAVCNFVLEMDRKRIVFGEFTDVSAELEGAYKPFKWLSKRQILQRYLDAELLLLDDVQGSRDEDRASDLERKTLYEIIKDRNAKNLRTIITSNYDLQQLEKKGFNPRTTSRIREMCKIDGRSDVSGVINLDGVDRRLTMQEGTV